MWLQVVAPVLSFLGVEVLLFASVQTSGGNPGYFGLLHNALWALLRNVGAGVVVLSEGVATLAEGVGIAVAGVSAAAAARQAEGPLDDEEHGAARQGRGLLGTEERGAARQGGELSDAEERGEEDPEARPPPPYYVSVLRPFPLLLTKTPSCRIPWPLITLCLGTLKRDNIVLRDTEKDRRFRLFSLSILCDLRFTPCRS